MGSEIRENELGRCGFKSHVYRCQPLGPWCHHCEPHYLHLCKGALLEEKHGMTEEYTVPGKQHTLNQTM